MRRENVLCEGAFPARPRATYDVYALLGCYISAATSWERQSYLLLGVRQQALQQRCVPKLTHLRRQDPKTCC